MKQRVSILICGGSLAGTACAIRLKQLGHIPVVLDKSRFPRAKLCGEFLGPDAFPILAKLGLLDTVLAHAYGPIHKTYFYNRHGQALEIQHRWISKQFPYAVAIPRQILDHLLVQWTRQNHIPLLEERRILAPIRFQQNRFEIQVECRDENKNQQIETYDADFVIDATGRNGKLTVQQSSRNPATHSTATHKDWVGIQCHVSLNSTILNSNITTKDLSMFLFPNGYGGLQPISENKANICMMVKSSLAKNMHAEFDHFISSTIGQNPKAAMLLNGCSKEGSFFTTSDINLAHSQDILSSQKDMDLIRIGDAVVTIDPFTGSGMAHALETGVLAAEILHDGLIKRLDYQTIRLNYQQAYKKRFQVRLRFMRWFRPILESERMQEGVWPFISPFLPALAYIFR